jgi:hypothetical protein
MNLDMLVRLYKRKKQRSPAANNRLDEDIRLLQAPTPTVPMYTHSHPSSHAGYDMSSTAAAKHKSAVAAAPRSARLCARLAPRAP